MLDKHHDVKKIVDSEENTDIEIALELIKHLNAIEDSVLIKFKKNAQEQLLRRAVIAMKSMTNPLAKRLLKMRVWEC